MEPKNAEKDVQDMTRDLERALWAKWIPRLKTVSRQVSGGDAYNWGYSDQVGQDVASYEGVPGPIADRFEILGILSEAGLSGISKWNSANESEYTKLKAWADRFLAPGGHPIWNTK